jgi:hypothetical protein
MQRIGTDKKNKREQKNIKYKIDNDKLKIAMRSVSPTLKKIG